MLETATACIILSGNNTPDGCVLKFVKGTHRLLVVTVFVLPVDRRAVSGHIGGERDRWAVCGDTGDYWDREGRRAGV